MYTIRWMSEQLTVDTPYFDLMFMSDLKNIAISTSILRLFQSQWLIKISNGYCFSAQCSDMSMQPRTFDSSGTGRPVTM
jgi:hypothetical protein